MLTTQEIEKELENAQAREGLVRDRSDTFLANGVSALWAIALELRQANEGQAKLAASAKATSGYALAPAFCPECEALYERDGHKKGCSRLRKGEQKAKEDNAKTNALAPLPAS